MKKLVCAIALFASTQAFAAESVVEGTIVKIVPKATEIYVEAEGKKHEYYFNKETTVESKGQKMAFADLKTGMKVKVTADKKGKRLDPKTVEILEPAQ